MPAATAPRRLFVTRLHVRMPRDFAFWPAVTGHGWCALMPFAHDAGERWLKCVLTLGSAVVACTLTSHRSSVCVLVESRSPLLQTQRDEVLRQTRAMLRMDEDFRDFHRVARRDRATRWIARGKLGRLLRAPTVFEDITKMICTTNCTWSLTTLMVKSLVETFGGRSPVGTHAFPLPEAIAGSSESELRSRCRTGYRAPYLLHVADMVASGKIDVESWRTAGLASDELLTRLRSLPGIGPYAAENMLKLLGHYDHLGLDTWVRQRYCQLHTRGRRVSDAAIMRAYVGFGQWRALFFWLEMTRSWREEKFRT